MHYRRIICIFVYFIILFFFHTENNVVAMRKHNPLYNLISSTYLCQKYIEEILKYSDIQDIINSHTEYDLVIAQIINTDAIFAFGYKFKAPVIAFFQTAMLPSNNWILGNPFPSSYIPNLFSPYTEKMSLFARIVNTMYNFITGIYVIFIIFYYFFYRDT